MDDRRELPNLNQDFCLKVTMAGASVCVGWLIIAALILIAVGPGNKRCPGWIIYSENGSGTSLWILVGVFTAAPAFWLCYVVFHWERFMQKTYDVLMGKILPPAGLLGIKHDPAVMFLVDSNKLCVRVIIAWCLFCAFPLWMVLTHCTDLPIGKLSTDLFRYLREL